MQILRDNLRISWRMMLFLVASLALLAELSDALAFQHANDIRIKRHVNEHARHHSAELKNVSFLPWSRSRSHSSALSFDFGHGEADFMEVQAGGMRYEMVELPDSLVEETCFVGNLDEFVTDEMLSILFQQVSTLKFIPACVARKPNASSLKYGFAIFPTVAEKEAAIIRFNGHLLNNKPLRVESIIDYKYRVRVPEKLVYYTVGEAKRTRDGSNNTLRTVGSECSRFNNKAGGVRRGAKKDRKRDRTGSRMSMSRSGGNSRTKTSGKWKKKERRRKRRDNADSIW